MDFCKGLARDGQGTKKNRFEFDVNLTLATLCDLLMLSHLFRAAKFASKNYEKPRDVKASKLTTRPG